MTNLIARASAFVLSSLLCVSAWALTPAQLLTIKADITANADLNAQPLTLDGAFAIAAMYNTAASPAWIVWKRNVPINDVGKAFNGAELAGMTTGNQTRLQTLALYLADGVNPTLADNRAFFDDVFSGAGGTNTRANLLVLWKRPALRIEKLFSTGTGTTASPATLTVEGSVSLEDIVAARQ